MFALFAQCVHAYAQSATAEIFIPLDDRSEIWLKPRIDTLDNLKEYEFRIRVVPEYKINQFLFEKGLAIQTDSVLKIIPNSTKYGDIDTATLRVVVTSIHGSRIILFQKRFFVRVPERLFPVINGAKTNLMKINDKELLERNHPYPKQEFVKDHVFITMYDNTTNMKQLEVKNVSVAIYEQQGKQFESHSDTLTMDAIKELRKIKNPTPVYIRVEAQAPSGKSKKVIWNKIVIYSD